MNIAEWLQFEVDVSGR